MRASNIDLLYSQYFFNAKFGNFEGTKAIIFYLMLFILKNN